MSARRGAARLAFALALTGCHSPPPANCPADSTQHWDSSGPAYQYLATAGEGAEELCVAAHFPASVRRIALARALAPFVREVELQQEGAWQPIPSTGGTWALPQCSQSGCDVRYRFLLGAAARDLMDRDAAYERDSAFFAPTSSWLLRPVGDAPHGRFRVHVATPPGLSFVTGLHRSAIDTYEGDSADLASTPYSAFGRFDVVPIALPSGSVDIAFAAGSLPRPLVTGWIDTSTRAVASYFGRFPVDRALLLVLPDDGASTSGATMGGSGAAVSLSVGADVTAASLANDWVLVHELVHVSFPNVWRPWAEEGLATYAEPILRARAGLLSADEVWRGLLEGLPEGLPEPGDEGLDRTDTWGRRYWGGALYWFLADLSIREQTGDARSLDDALRAIVAAGGTVEATWPLEHVLDIGDSATGTTALRTLHAQMASAPVTIDLDRLFQRLGVALQDGRIVYDDGAPLAAIRRSIAAPR